MATLSEVTKQADTLSIEEKAGLVSHLLDSLPDAPLGPDDEEVMRRDEEMDSDKEEASKLKWKSWVRMEDGSIEDEYDPFEEDGEEESWWW